MSREDILLQLISELDGRVPGTTRLMKIAYILGEELRKKGIRIDFYDFNYYKHGPYQSALVAQLESWRRAGVLDKSSRVKGIHTENVWILSPLSGTSIEQSARRIPDNVKAVIHEVAQKYGHHSLESLLWYVYEKYPRFLRTQAIPASD